MFLCECRFSTVARKSHEISFFFFAQAIPIKCFVSHRPISCDGGSVGQKKEKKLTLEGVWVPEKAGLLSKKAWLQSQLDNIVFDYQMFKPGGPNSRLNTREGCNVIYIPQVTRRCRVTGDR